MSLTTRFAHPATRAVRGRRPVRTARLAKTQLCLEALETRTLLDVSLSVGDNVLVRPKPGNQSESSIAMNPTNPQNLFAVSNDTASSVLYANYSMDGGVTWTPSNVLAVPTTCCDAQTAWDSFGNLFVTYLNRSLSVVTIMSSDGGQTFSLLNTTTGNLDQPSIAVGPSNFGDGTGSVWISYADRGRGVSVKGAVVNGLGDVSSFTSPAKVAPISGSGNFGNIAVGPNGQVMVTYELPPGGEGPAALYVSLDADGLSGNFGPRVLVTTTNVGGFAHITPQPTRSIDAEANLAYDRSGGPNNGRVYLVYTDRPSVNGPDRNDTDIYLRYSDDDGMTWSDPVLVNDDGATGKAQFNPAIAVDQSVGSPTAGFVALTWYDSRNSALNNSAEVWGTVSTDGGQTFLPNVQISTGLIDAHASDRSFEFGDYDTMDFYNGSFYRGWADNTLPGHSGLDLATAQVSVVFTGRPFGQPRPHAGTISFRALTDGGDREVPDLKRHARARTDSPSQAAALFLPTASPSPSVAPGLSVATPATEAVPVLADRAGVDQFFAVAMAEEQGLPASGLKQAIAMPPPDGLVEVLGKDNTSLDWSPAALAGEYI